jgi:type VI secretion system protein ImpK
MTDTDPFAGLDVESVRVKPRPKIGGDPTGSESRPSTLASGAAPVQSKVAPLSVDALLTNGLNPLVAAASPLLYAAAQLRETLELENLDALKNSLIAGIEKFEATARSNGTPNNMILAARYALCTALDEAVACTPWGGAGRWQAHSLLVRFHNETWGGEKIFQLLSKLATEVKTNRHVLELFYLILAFGYEGRYRVLDNGRAKLDGIRQRLAHLLIQARGAIEPDLSVQWRGSPSDQGKLYSNSALLGLIAVLLLLLATLYAWLLLSINERSDEVLSGLYGLTPPALVVAAPVTVRPPEPPRPAPQKLAHFLQPEIDAGLVTVDDLEGRSIIRIKGDGFFASGKADINPNLYPLLKRIAEALNSQAGRILIVGHTDSQPIRSLRFPSNWNLSTERANQVMQVLLADVDASRMTSEGRADAEPRDSNSTPEGRALNRRVEITLILDPGSSVYRVVNPEAAGAR